MQKAGFAEPIAERMPRNPETLPQRRQLYVDAQTYQPLRTVMTLAEHPVPDR